MIDVHSHILYGIDDGSRNIEESIKIIESYNKMGIKDIIATPHYINDSSYVSSKDNNLKILNNLQNQLIKRNIDTKLYLGNEIYIDEKIEDLLKEGIISSLNNSKYLLIELPMSGKKDNYYDIFIDLINNGYKVVLAHPERYISFQKDFNRIYELDEIGVLFQCNLGSIIGEYGSKAKKTIKRLLKEDLVFMLGTDIHRDKGKYLFINKAIKKISKYTPKDKLEKITEKNAKKIIS
ncbi:MAG: histidinol phosphatase [Bacilli bacterium]|nr:histidinol phosphatase [Bacilli bacterium]